MTTLDELARGAADAAHESMAPLAFDDAPEPPNARPMIYAAVAAVLVAVGLWAALRTDESATDLDTVDDSLGLLPPSADLPYFDLETDGLIAFDIGATQRSSREPIVIYLENDDHAVVQFTSSPVPENLSLREEPVTIRQETATMQAHFGSDQGDGLLWVENDRLFTARSAALGSDELDTLVDALVLDGDRPQPGTLPFGFSIVASFDDPEPAATLWQGRQMWLEAADGTIVRLTVETPGERAALWFSMTLDDAELTTVRGASARIGTFVEQATAIGWLENGHFIRVQIAGTDQDDRLRELAASLRPTDLEGHEARIRELPLVDQRARTIGATVGRSDHEDEDIAWLVGISDEGLCLGQWPLGTGIEPASTRCMSVPSLEPDEVTVEWAVLPGVVIGFGLVGDAVTTLEFDGTNRNPANVIQYELGRPFAWAISTADVDPATSLSLGARDDLGTLLGSVEVPRELIEESRDG